MINNSKIINIVVDLVVAEGVCWHLDASPVSETTYQCVILMRCNGVQWMVLVHHPLKCYRIMHRPCYLQLRIEMLVMYVVSIVSSGMKHERTQCILHSIHGCGTSCTMLLRIPAWETFWTMSLCRNCPVLLAPYLSLNREHKYPCVCITTDRPISNCH